MDRTEQAASPSSYPATPAPLTAPAARTRVRVPAWAGVLWRYRAWLAGLTALVLAGVGETLMRPGPGDVGAINGALGTGLVQVAVLLVGLVAWVRDGLRLPGRATPV